MPDATIHSTSDCISWNSTYVVRQLTENDSTLVTNSFGATVYWWSDGKTGSIDDGVAFNCERGPVVRFWYFASQPGSVTPELTLLIDTPAAR